MSPRGRATVAAVAIGVQVAVLYAPRAPAVDTSGLPMDKLVHAAVFLVPTLALVAAGVPRAWAVGLMAVHAPVSEWIQLTVLEARAGEILDVVADLAGVAVAAFLTRPGGRFAAPDPAGSHRPDPDPVAG